MTKRKGQLEKTNEMGGIIDMQSYYTVAPAKADQKTQEAFDAYLDRIYAQWISENPFQIHFLSEHPENYGIELSSYTLMDYSEYDEAAMKKAKSSRRKTYELEVI